MTDAVDPADGKGNDEGTDKIEGICLQMIEDQCPRLLVYSWKAEKHQQMVGKVREGELSFRGPDKFGKIIVAELERISKAKRIEKHV